MRSAREKLIAWMVRVRADRPVFGLALAIIVASVLLCANVYYDYRKTLENEYLALERQSLLAGARIGGVLRGLDIGLYALVADEKTDPPIPAEILTQRQQTFLSQFPEVDAVFVADATGRVVRADSLSNPQYIQTFRDFNVSQRDYFSFHRSAKAGEFARTYVARPFVALSGRHMVAVSRAIRDADGQFRGVITATLKSDVFDPVLGEIVQNPAVDAAAVHNRFGDILYRLPFPEKYAGKNIASGEAFQAYLRSTGEFTRHLGVVATDDTKRILVFNRIGDSGLDVGVSCRYAVAMAAWQDRSLLKAAVLVLFVALALILIRVARRQRESDEALRASEVRYGLILKHSPTGIFHYDRNLVITYCNDRFATILGSSRDKLIGLDMRRLRDQRIVPALEAALSGNPGYFEGEYFTTTSEQTIWVTLAISSFIAEGGSCEGGIGIITDITQRKTVEQALQEAKERLEAAASAGIVGIWDWDVRNDRLIWDQVMFQLHGARADKFAGRGESWLSTVHADDRDRVTAAVEAARQGAGPFTPEYRVVWPDGSVHYLKTSSRASHDAAGAVIRLVGVNYDLTEQKTIQAELDRLAYFDRLTGLPNRRLLEDRLVQDIARAERSQQKLGLLYIDLDRFKPVNDELGHATGDWLLQRVAERMQDCLRKTDTVARLGGDEFVVLLASIKDADEAINVAEKIRMRIREPFVAADDKTLTISSSIGVVLYPDHADNPRDLLLFGDQAMYRAKKHHRDTVFVYSPDISIPLQPGGSGVIRLVWQAGYSSGQTDIDHEHQQLFDVANTLIELATGTEQNKAALHATLDKLLAHLREHFAHEETILRSQGYAGLNEHIDQHRQLIEQALELEKNSRDSVIPTGRLVDFIVTEVIQKHLLQSDAQYFDLFNHRPDAACSSGSVDMAPGEQDTY